MTAAPALAQDRARINPTDPQPTCAMCPGSYIPAAELEGYAKSEAQSQEYLSKLAKRGE